MTIVTKAATPDYLSGHERIWGNKEKPLAAAPQPVQLGTLVEIDGVAKVFTERGWEVSSRREVEVLMPDGWILTDMMSLKDGEVFRMFDVLEGERKPVIGLDNETQWVVDGLPFLMGDLPGVKVRDEKA